MDCNRIGIDIDKICYARLTGLHDLMILINYDDINWDATVYDAENDMQIKDIRLKAGKRGYYVQGVNMSNNTVTSLEQRKHIDGWNHGLHFMVFNNTPEIKQYIKTLPRGRFIALVENIDRNMSGTFGETSFEVFGWDVGLRIREATRDAKDSDSVGGWILEAGTRESKEPDPPKSFFDTDYATTLSRFVEIYSTAEPQPPPEIDFSIKVKTDNDGVTNNNQFRIPTKTEADANSIGFEYDYTVQRCDGVGNVLETLTGLTEDVTLTWDTAGEYIVKIKGTFPSLYFWKHQNPANGDARKLTEVHFDDYAWRLLTGAFWRCENLTVLTGTPNLTNLIDKGLASTFAYCRSLNADFTGWDISKITSLNYMFRDCDVFNSDISGWDVSNVTRIAGMFERAPAFNQNIGGWNTAKVTDMGWVFSGASAFNQNIGNWNVGSVTNMYAMFASASAFNQNIGGWNTAKVTDMEAMFSSASSFNQDLSGWCVELIAEKPVNFDLNATAWVLDRPIWGTCPA